MNGTAALGKIRQQYPMYQDMGDRDLAKAIIAKYPQYSDMLGEIASPPSTIQQGYRAVKRVASKPFEWAGALDVASGIKTPEQAAQRAQTYGGITTDLALTAPLVGGLGSLGRAVAPFLGGGRVAAAAPAVGRVAGSAASGGLTAAGKGDDATTGAILGGIGGTAGEAAGWAVPRAPGWLRSLWQATPMGKKGVEAAKVAATAERTAATAAAKQTEKTAAQMAKDTRASIEASRIGRQAKLPGLDAKTSDDLYRLAAGGKGREILNQRFGQTVAELDDALKTQRITGIRVPLLGDTPMTIREAVDELQLIGKGVGRAAPGERSVTQNLASLDYGRAKQALIGRMNELLPGSGDRLGQALTESARGRAYLKLLGQSMDKNGRLDPDKLLAAVNKQAGKLAEKFGTDWSRMQGVLTGGQPLPVRIPPKITGPAWMPTPPAAPVPRSLSPAGQVATDVIMSQPAPAAAAVGAGEAALRFLHRIPGVGHGADLIYDTIGED